MKRVLVGKDLPDLQDSATRNEIAGNLRDIRISNRLLSGSAVVLCHLTRLIGESPVRQPVKILDMATGSADIPVAIVRWARKRNISVRITALDRHPIVAELAEDFAQDFQEISVEQKDILNLNYDDCSFDFVVCSQIIHHLENEEVMHVLRSANRLGSRGVVVSDLHSRRMSICLAAAFSNLVLNRLSRHDGRISFRNAFNKPELAEIAELCGLPCCEIYTHGPFRLALVIDKRTTVCHTEKSVSRAPAVI